MKIYFCTHGGGTNWGLPNNIAAIRESLKRKHIVGVEMDLFISSDGVIFPGNPFIKSDPDSWGNSWLGLTKHPGEMSWAELSKLRYELGKAEEELSLINESSAKIERVPENYSLHSIDTLPSSPKEFHFHIEMPTTTNAKSQIADMAKFLGEWLSAGKNLQGEIYVH